MKMLKTIALALVIIVSILSKEAKACKTDDVAAISIIMKMCHTCIFPLSIAGIQVMQGPMPDPSDSVRTPICICKDPFPRIGIPIAFFEPSRIIETVTDPFCFPTFGVSTSNGSGKLGGKTNDGSSSSNTFMQTHYLIFPAYRIIEAFSDFLCMQSSGVDYAYITEVDPTWNSDVLGAFLSPEALLFGNPVTNLACIADSVSSGFYYPLDVLFWCMGSWGNSYPLTGHKPTSDSFVQDASAIAAKTIYKLHRQLMLWGSWGQAGLCGYYPMPIWRKTAYRLQIVTPIAHPIATTIGQTGMTWDYGKKLPMTYDNFGFLLFKKRDCCML